ncbi:MAG: hypothetical protein WD059_05200 [Balneolaceae bacterium]
MNKNIFKSIGAVLGGFIVIVVLSVGTDAILKAAELLPYDHLFVSTELIVFVIFYRAFYSLIGCYIAAKLAPSNPMKHALALGGVGIIVGSIGAVVAGHLGPAWYAWTLVVIALPVAWLGGRLFELRSNRSRMSEVVGINDGR